MKNEQNDDPELFVRELSTTNSGPVTCLGLSFPSDEERRNYFLNILREKLRDSEFRKIEGFPIGTDEDILALSDPPYYTACPNPFIDDFIKHYGKPYDPNVLYSREPFAADVSEGKNDPIYNAHSYHTKVPHKAILRYILHYTEPGDIVFDGFCGTGMTGVAAQMCGNKAEVESLSALLELEYNARKERTARTRLKLSGMPQAKSFEEFDLSWLKGGLTRERFEEIKSLAFIERKENVLFLGPSGVGKTHLLLAIGQKACTSGYTAYYKTCYEAIDSLIRAREQGRLRKRLAWLKKPHVLLIDEVGYEPLTPEQAHVFFQLINARYETGSIIMTSNKPFSKWAELMSDEAVATAMLDRLLHHAQVVSLKADSYRMKERLRVGAVGFE